MRNAPAWRAGERSDLVIVLPYVEIREGKKIAARKGGSKDQLGLILRQEEYHQGDNFVNNYLSEKNIEILRGEVLFHGFYQHNS